MIAIYLTSSSQLALHRRDTRDVSTPIFEFVCKNLADGVRARIPDQDFIARVKMLETPNADPAMVDKKWLDLKNQTLAKLVGGIATRDPCSDSILSIKNDNIELSFYTLVVSSDSLFKTIREEIDKVATSCDIAGHVELKSSISDFLVFSSEPHAFVMA